MDTHVKCDVCNDDLLSLERKGVITLLAITNDNMIVDYILVTACKEKCHDQILSNIKSQYFDKDIKDVFSQYLAPTSFFADQIKELFPIIKGMKAINEDTYNKIRVILLNLYPEIRTYLNTSDLEKLKEIIIAS